MVLPKVTLKTTSVARLDFTLGRTRTCGRINQLQDQGTPGDDARSSGQEVPAMSLGVRRGAGSEAAFPPREDLSQRPGPTASY